MISIKRLLLAISLLIATTTAFATTQAGQFQQSGRYQIHYMALSTTFLTPEVSKNYGIKRSRYNAFVNISILDTLQPGNPAVRGQVTGKAINLTGNTKTLKFKEIIEGDAIYYIAQLPFRNEERFTISVDSVNRDGLNSKINFKQQFYAD